MAKHAGHHNFIEWIVRCTGPRELQLFEPRLAREEPVAFSPGSGSAIVVACGNPRTEAWVSDDGVDIAMSIPLDVDGFLRRECPTCEREFKWFPNDNDDDDVGDAIPVPDGGYYCPYCGVQAPADAWFTQAQLVFAENLIEVQVMGPMLKDLAKDVRGMGRRSGGLVSASVKYDEPEELDPLTEEDDMRRVDFGCHASEPVKVLEDWTKPVRCLICGEPA